MNTTITTAVPGIPLPVLHDPESITPTLPWNHSERRHSIHATLDHHPCETESHFDGWNSQQFQEDPFPNTTITTTTYDDQKADSEPIPFRMIRRPSLSRQPMMVTNTLRLQDVLGRLDLDDTETNDTDNHHEHSLLQNVTNDSPGIDNDHDANRTRKQQDLSWACSIDNDDTMDSYFWNTKSPCKWYHHHHPPHHSPQQQQQQQQLPHDTSYNHSNKKRRRYNPQLSSPLVVDDAFATALEDIDTSTTNDTGWTTFPCQNEDHHEDTIDGNPFDWTNSDMMDPYSTTSNHTVHPNTSFSPSLLSTLDVTTTTKTVSFTTPVPTLRKKPYPVKCGHPSTDPNTMPPPLPTKQSYCVDTCDTTRVVSAHSTTTPVGETNTTNQDHSHVDRTCPEDAYDNDDDDAIPMEPSTTIETIADPTWCQLLLQQKEAIQENDLLLRNNRQVLHRLAYEQIMGIHAHHSKPNT